MSCRLNKNRRGTRRTYHGNDSANAPEFQSRAGYVSRLRFIADRFVFGSEKDAYTPIHPCTVTTWQRRFTKRHGLRPLSPHDLRHSAASLALEAGANLKDVQNLLGHADPSTTMQFYSGLTEERERKTVAGIERLLSAKKEPV